MFNIICTLDEYIYNKLTDYDYKSQKTLLWKTSILLSFLSYFQHPDNRHNLPYLKDYLCKIGRHDYEFSSLTRDYAILKCFNCEAIKRSGYLNSDINKN